MALRNIRLELARDHDFPNGSPERGYEFSAPLTDDGHLDQDEWRDVKEQCTVRRFWHGEDDEHGHLVHRGRGWSFHYDEEPVDEDEPLFKLDRHILIEGEYVSITEHDGVLRTFRIARVH